MFSPMGTPSTPHPMPEAEVLPLGSADLIDCLTLDRLALGGLWSEEQWGKELMEPKRPVVGVREQGRLLALASGWVVVDELHITAVAVHPEARRRGLGRRVLLGLLRQAQRAGAERATLEVSSANVSARALYTSLGFSEVAIRRGYYRNGDDALIEWIKLE